MNIEPGSPALEAVSYQLNYRDSLTQATFYKNEIYTVKNVLKPYVSSLFLACTYVDLSIIDLSICDHLSSHLSFSV